jgi:type I restriction enzyme M protein
LFFLKAISDQNIEESDNFIKEHGVDEEDLEDYFSLFRFIIPEEARFSYILNSTAKDCSVDRLLRAFRLIGQNNPELSGIFYDAEFIIERVNSKNLMEGYFQSVLRKFSTFDLRPSSLRKGTEVGDIFIQLIQLFASESWRKGGEYYTPASVTRLLTELLDPINGDEIYDPACGTGSFLISLLNNVKKSKSEPNYTSLYGQEINSSTHSLAIMNVILNGVLCSDIKSGDTILAPAFVNEDSHSLKKFDIVISNPPFSSPAHGGDNYKKDPWGRFQWGIPPKSRSDFIFISHMLCSLKENEGRMGVIVPHGVLFRGAAEGTIRTNILNDNLLDAVIGLPHNLFFGTGIPAAIMIFRKDKIDKRVFFIDASKEFLSGKRQNTLPEESISKISETYRDKIEVDGYSKNVSFEEIIENDFNLNISRYIDDYKEEDDINLDLEKAKREELQRKLKTLECDMDNFLSQLVK